VSKRGPKSKPQTSERRLSETASTADPAFRIKATTMIDDLLNLYQFGISLDLMSEDTILYGHLCAIKKHFEILTPTAASLTDCESLEVGFAMNLKRFN
jgi:hypothetical protein